MKDYTVLPRSELFKLIDSCNDFDELQAIRSQLHEYGYALEGVLLTTLNCKLDELRGIDNQIPKFEGENLPPINAEVHIKLPSMRRG